MATKTALGLWFVSTLATHATTPLTESRFTQVINEVKVIQMPTLTAAPAKVEAWVRSPDRVRTGADSMAELEAPDRTVTRIGANTVFSFGQDRSMNLERGSVLFHSPKGKGGGKINTGGASASVVGTTIIVCATDDGGFKTIVLEGKAQVKLPNGDSRLLNAGQLAFVLPGSKRFGPDLDINLGKLVKGAGLVNDFKTPLSSVPRIEEAVLKQNHMIASGQAVDTGMFVGRHATEDSVEVVDAATVARLIQNKPPALREDAVITGTDKLPGDHVLPAGEIPNAPTTVVAARNLSLRSTTIDLTPQMDAGASGFGFYADEDLSVEGSVNLNGNGRTDFGVTLHGERRLKIKSRARLTAAGVGDVTLESGRELNVTHATISNRSGDLNFNARGPAEWDHSTIIASGGISSEAASQDVTGGRVVAGSEAVSLDAVSGDLNVNSIPIQGRDTILHAAQDVNVNHSSCLVGRMISVDAGRNLTVANTTLIGNSIAAQAGETLTWQSTTFNGASSIGLAARTLILEDVDFPSGSSVELKSELGRLAPQPNTGRTAVAGHVNFISNVNYGGAPAQNAIGSGITILPR
jgi:hypothetical protein